MPPLPTAVVGPNAAVRAAAPSSIRVAPGVPGEPKLELALDVHSIPSGGQNVRPGRGG